MSPTSVRPSLSMRQYGEPMPIPWMTLVGYFNSMRELGGVRRLVFDDVSPVPRRWIGVGLAKRLLRCRLPGGIDQPYAVGGNSRRFLTAWRPVFDPELDGQAEGDVKKKELRNGPKKPHRRAAGHEHGFGRRGREAAWV